MLGRIPVLYLHFCQAITDISALNHNQRIQITLCDGIEDFTQSFEQAEDIVIRASSRVLPHVNFNHWKKVKKLMISCYNITLTSFDIPHTVIDCSFNGMIEANFQGLRNPDYRLRELQIINSSIISLEDLGLERLIVIELACLTQLASLEGIGFGRNRRISIRDCPLITDFSPLRYTYQVEIKTNQKVNLSVLDHVYSLKITAEELIFDSLPFQGNIYSLEISVKFFDLHDLKMIPFLIIPSTHIPIIEQYLELGGKLLNQRIDIIFLGREQQAETRHRIQPFFDRFLQSDFQFQEMVRKVASEFYASYYSWAFLRKQI